MKRKFLFLILFILILTVCLAACDLNGKKGTIVENPPKFLDLTIEYEDKPLNFDYSKKIPIIKEEDDNILPIDLVLTFENPDNYSIVSMKINGEIYYAKDFRKDTPQKVVISYTPEDNIKKEIEITEIYYKADTRNLSIKNLECPILQYDFNLKYNLILDRSEADNTVKSMNFEIGYLGDFDYFLPEKGDDNSLETGINTFKRYNIFKGYFTDLDGKTRINIGDLYRYNYDLTVYALFEENYTYKIHEDFVEITGFNNYALSLVDYTFNIPNTYEGLPVTKIGDKAFEKSITGFHLKLSESIIEIGNDAFKNSALIVNFDNAINLQKIGNYAFQNVSLLTIRKFPDSLTEIGEGAFIGCSWNSVTPSGNGSLASSLVIDTNIKKIGKEAFKNSGFKRIYIMEGNPNLELGEGVFEAMPNLEEINLATKFGENSNMVEAPTLSSIKEISARCFFGNSQLKVVKLQEGVKEIGENAFARNTNLKSFTLPNSVNILHNKAFIACSALTVFAIGSESNLIKIGDEVFSGCTALKTIEIKSQQLALFGSSVFYNCLQMQSIFFYGNAPTINSGNYLYIEGNNDFFIYTPKDHLEKYKENFSVARDYGKLRITAKEFILQGSSMVDGVYPNIACFELLKDGTLKLLRVFDKNLKSLDVSLFETNSALDNAIRFKKISEVGENFVAKTVEEVILPSTIKVIAKGAFKNCTNLSKVTTNGDSTFRSLVNLETIGEQAFESTKINKFYAPKNLKTIDYKAFYDCKSLKDVKIINLENELTIGRDVFYLSPLKSVYLGKNVVSVGSNAFAYSLTSSESPLRELYIFRETASNGNLSATDFSGTLYFHNDIKIYLSPKEGVLDEYMKQNNFKALKTSGNLYINEKIESEELYNE